MITVFDALNQTQAFINELTKEWSPQQRTIFNMFLMSQIVSSEIQRSKE